MKRKENHSVEKHVVDIDGLILHEIIIISIVMVQKMVILKTDFIYSFISVYTHNENIIFQFPEIIIWSIFLE